MRFGDRVRRDRTRAILEQTLMVLSDTGYTAFRVEEVAHRVGVAKGTIYLTFPSKEGLIDSALDWAALQLVDQVKEAIAAVEDLGARLLKAFAFLVEIAHERRDLAVLVEARPVRGSAEGGPVPCKPLRELLQGIVEAGGLETFKGMDGAATAEAILGLLARPDWRRMAAEVGPEEALHRSGLAVTLPSVSR